MWGAVSRYPKAIVHVDGDSFFVACEVAKDPSLKGKYVVTGKERGIASALSYECKARGAKRGMRLSEIRALCPGLIVLPSDYETYSLYSERMYDILRRYTPEVEEYSIDECFADITGLRSRLHLPYEDIAEKIKYDLDRELGITFSVGLSVNKVLAKVASKWKKPSGFTFIPYNKISEYLGKWPARKIWGIGPNTAAHLERYNIKTSLEFATKPETWVLQEFDKPIQEIYWELNGKFIYPLTIGRKDSYASISKTKTFTPPSNNKEFIYSQLSKNIENACIKLRRHELFARKISFFLKTQEFRYHGLEIELDQRICIPQEFIKAISPFFEKVYRLGTLYRATGVMFSDVSGGEAETLDLFGAGAKINEINKIYKAIDEVSHRFGKHTVFLGSSFLAMKNSQHRGERGDKAGRAKHLFRGETSRRRIGLPFMGIVH